MNTAKTINLVAQTEDIETTTIGSLDTPSKPPQRVMRGTRLRYGLLLATALLSTWLAITVFNSIKQLNTEFDHIYAVVTSPPR